MAVHRATRLEIASNAILAPHLGAVTGRCLSQPSGNVVWACKIVQEFLRPFARDLSPRSGSNGLHGSTSLHPHSNPLPTLSSVGASLAEPCGRCSEIHFSLPCCLPVLASCLLWARPNLPSLTQLCASCTMALIMSDAQIRTERRSLRLWMSIQVCVSGKNIDGENFSEDTETTVVNAHGGLLFLYQPVKIRADIVLTNRVTNEEQACRVVSLRKASDKGMHVGIEFLLPSPHFWGLEFPPDNWPAA
jgi:hypothetical protein